MLLLSVMEYGMMKANKKFKMWYLAGAGSMHKHRQSFYTCYAESKDGKHWEKVNMDIVPGTNIVDTCDRDAATVWLDKMCPEPEKRFKFFNVEKHSGGWKIILKIFKRWYSLVGRSCAIRTGGGSYHCFL